MILKEHELLQIDDQFIRRLREKDPDALAELSIHLTHDLKEALERLNQSPSNSSKPSGSLAPWDKGSGDDDTSTVDEQEALDSEIDKERPSNDVAKITDEDPHKESPFRSENLDKHRKPGRQPGSQGFGRTQQLDVIETIHYVCGCCTVCHEDLGPVEKAYTGFQTVNIEFGHPDKTGMYLSNT